MKLLAVTALVCATMALTRALALPEAHAENAETAKSRLVKRAAACPGGWSEFRGRCFHFVPRPMTWARAEKNCLSMGGNLASVHNILEYHEIQRLIMTTSYEYKQTWIGGTDAQEENQWFWSDGTTFTYANWCGGEPNNYKGKQHCLQINHTDQKCWDDLECSYQRPSVCARKA